MMKFSSSFMALSAIHVMNGLRDGRNKNVGDHPEINSNTKKKYITGKEVAIVTNRHDKQTSKEHMEDDPYGNMKNNRAYDSNNKPMPLSISNNNIAGDNKMKRRYSIDKNYDFTSFVQSESMGNISPAPRDKKGMLNYKLFFRAAEDGDIAVLQSFLNEGVDINMTKRRSGDSALHLVVAEDDDHTVDVVTFLLQEGIDVGLENKLGETALQIAEEEGFEDIANLIKTYANAPETLSRLKEDSSGVLHFDSSGFDNDQESSSNDDSQVIGSYKIFGRLGKGGFGVVYEVCRVGDKEDRTYALKAMRNMDERHLIIAQKETAILNKLKHDNIIEHKESFVYEKRFYMVMAVANRGDLSQLIVKQKAKGTSWPKLFICNALKQIVSGLNHAHENNTMHRDLKPANVLVHALVSDRGDGWEIVAGAIQLKLSDFGLARVMDTSKDYASTQCGIRMLDREKPKSRPSCKQILQHLIDIDNGTYKFAHEDLPSQEDLSLDECVEHIIVLASANGLQDKFDRMIFLFQAIEAHLTNEGTQKDVIGRLSKSAWVPADVGENNGQPSWLTFDYVAADVPTELMPHIGRLWNGMPAYRIFTHIPEQVPTKVILKTMESDNCQNIDFCCSAAREIAQRIRRIRKQKGIKARSEIAPFFYNIHVPTRENVLEPASRVGFVDRFLYNDTKSPVYPYTDALVHRNISDDDAEILGSMIRISTAILLPYVLAETKSSHSRADETGNMQIDVDDEHHAHSKKNNDRTHQSSGLESHARPVKHKYTDHRHADAGVSTDLTGMIDVHS
eukprot:gene366-780_t